MAFSGSGSGSGGEAECRATVNAEIRHLWRDVGLLWDHNRKRRAEIERAEVRLSAEIEAIRARINGAIYSAAAILAALLFGVIRPKLGL
jgi:hypothetical protein